MRTIDTTAIASLTTIIVGLSGPAAAQKHGGTLRLYVWDNPPSASIHEEATISTGVPFMPVFNNLVLYDHKEKLNRPENIRPELAVSWSWDASATKITFNLRDDVRWHDGKPFTARDVVCTMELLQGKSKDRFRKNPRQSWWQNLKETVASGDHEVTMHLGRPQPSFLSFFANGYNPVYPCHVTAAEMRSKPIGTGPMKFVEFKANQSVRLVRNSDYWRKGKPYLDAIEWRVIPSRSTRMLAFVAGEVDMTFVVDATPTLTKDLQKQSPNAICELAPLNTSSNLIINRDAPPFNDPKLRRALALTLDRKVFNDIINEGHGRIGGAMTAPPEGAWGMPPVMIAELPGYGDVTANRGEARKIMESFGYGPSNRMKLKVSARNIPPFTDPAVILIDQLKQIYIDAELEPIDTSVWYNKVTRGDYAVGQNGTGMAIDDPDVNFYENYACGSERNYSKYCNPEVDKAIDAQSRETDVEKRKKLVWEVEKMLARDVARPIIFQGAAGFCRHPHVKNFTLQHNSIYNSWRFDDLWLEK